MAKTARVEQVTAAPSPRRERLAEAIARKRVIMDRLIRINSALEITFVWDAQEKVEKAESGLADARKNEPRRLIAGLVGESAVPGPSVEQAQWALDEAREDFKQALATRDALDTQRRETELALESADRATRDAIRNVIQAEGNALKELERYREAQAEVARRAEVISLLDAWNCLPPRAINLHPYFPPTHAERPWAEALTALEADATAPLPE